MKNKKHFFTFLLLLVLVIGAVYAVGHQLLSSKAKVVSDKDELRTSKSISQKVGVFVWPYKNYQKRDNNHTYIDTQLKIAKKIILNYT